MTGWRALVSSYRARLLVAIVLVVAVALGLVLVSLPRLLEGFFLDQEQANLRTRADAVATLLADELAVVAGAGARPILLPNEPGISTTLALGDAKGGKVRELTDEIARADVLVTLAAAAGEEPAWQLDVAYPDGAGGAGQNREPGLSARAVATRQGPLVLGGSGSRAGGGGHPQQPLHVARADHAHHHRGARQRRSWWPSWWPSSWPCCSPSGWRARFAA